MVAIHHSKFSIGETVVIRLPKVIGMVTKIEFVQGTNKPWYYIEWWNGDERCTDWIFESNIDAHT